MTENIQKAANPAPLGLLGFGMTTILLNLANAGIISLSSVIIAMGLTMGGLGQIIAGIMAYKKGDTFGATAFSAYGLFWWSLVFILVCPFKQIAAADSAGMGFYLLLWAIFTCFMFIGTLKHNRSSQLVFGSLTILFLLLSIGNFSGLPVVHTIAGWEGIICGAFAVYGSLAQVVNNEFGKKVLPL
jgi:uncharacterized protein